MKSSRVRLHLERLEERITPAPVGIGFGAGIFNFNVAGYNLHQNNSNHGTTSSAFGFSDAQMTQAQQVTTRNGGVVNAQLNDAFDGAISFGLSPNGTARSATTYFDADGVVDITGNTITGDPNTVGTDNNSFGGLQVSQQNAIFALTPTTPMIRSILTITNPTAAPITRFFGDFNNLGSDSNTTIFATSSGDTTFNDTVDRWVGTFQNFIGADTTSPDVRLLHVMQGPGTVQSPYKALWTGNGDDNPNWIYNVTVGPGETKRIMEFVGLYPSRAQATADGAIFDSNTTLRSSGLLAGLTTQQLSEIVNFALPPVIDGTAGDDTLIITATGPDSGTYSLNGGPAVPFTGISSFTFNGLGGNDLLRIIDPTGALFRPAGGVFYNGGTQTGAPGDRLELQGGAATNVVYNFSANGADGKNGNIIRDGSTITFTGLEPITNSGTAANIIFNLPNDGTNNQAILEDDAVPANGMSQLRSGNGTFESTVFANPSTSLTINANVDSEDITVNRLDSGFTAPVRLAGSAGNDIFHFGDGATLNGGTIDGAGGTNAIDYSAYTTPVAVNLGLGATSLAADLSSDQEVGGTASTASATAVASFNTTTKTLDITVIVTGITPAEVTGFHIHRAPVGVNGPIIIDFTGVGTITPTPAGFNYTVSNLPVDPRHEAALLGGITYVNIHTPAAPGGLIRGQLFSTGNLSLAGGTATGTGGIVNIQNATGGSGSFLVSGTPFGDSIVGNFAANVLRGGPQNDTIVGGPGADTMGGEDGNDVAVWSNGDGSDVIDGGIGADLVQVNGALNGAALNDSFTVGANGTRVAFARTSTGAFNLDIGTVETLTVNGIAGTDTFAVNSLAGVADLTAVNLNGFADNDTFNVMPAATAAVNVNGGLPRPPATPGDTLNVNVTGTTNALLSDSSTPLGLQGNYTFTNRQPVNFQQIETLTPLPNLVVTKADTPDPVTAGTDLTYAITVRNDTAVGVQNFSLSDTLPAGTTFVSALSGLGGSITAPPVGGTGTVTFTNPSFGANTIAIFQIVVHVGSNVAAGTTITNSAAASSSATETTTTDNTGTTTTTVITSADLAVTKTDTPDPVVAGTDLTYTLTLANNGPSDAQGVSLADTLPAGTTFVSTSAPAGWATSSPAVGGTGTVTFTRATFAASASSVFTIVVHVAANVAEGATIANSATATSSTPDPTPANNTATASTLVGTIADVAVTKVGTPNPVVAGNNVTYTITVTNNGPSNAQAYDVSDIVPGGTSLVSFNQTSGPAEGTTLPAGATATFVLVARVYPSVANGTNLVNTASVFAATHDSNTGNNTARATNTVATSADLAITKLASPSPVAAGSTLTYTLQLTNNGPSVASFVSLTDALPAGTTFVSATAPAGWSKSTPLFGNTGTVTFAEDSFAPGAATFSIVVQVASSTLGPIANTASVSSRTTDPVTGNNSSSTSTPVTNSAGLADLVVTKIASANPVTPGTNLTYTVTIHNAGVGPALNVVFQDNLSPFTSFVSNSGAPGWISTNPPVGSFGGVVTSTTPSLAAGATATFTIIVKVPAGTPRGIVITNTANATTSSTERDPHNLIFNQVTVGSPAPSIPPPGAGAVMAQVGLASPAKASPSTTSSAIHAQDAALATSGGLVADVLRQKTLSGLLGFGH